MSVKVRKINASKIQLSFTRAMEAVEEGYRVLVTKWGTPVVAVVSAEDLRAIQGLSRLRPDIISRLFKFCENSDERAALAYILSWRESFDQD